MATKPTKRKSTSAGARRGGTLGLSGGKAHPVSVPEPENVVTAAAPATGVADDDRLKRPDLIEAISKRVSLKRSEAKMVFDVVLDEIGRALDASDEVVVPPLGKLMVKKRMDKPNGSVLTVKLKRAAVDPAAGDVAPLADTDEGG